MARNGSVGNGLDHTLQPVHPLEKNRNMVPAMAGVRK